MSHTYTLHKHLHQHLSVLDIKYSFLEESAVSPAIMVYHLPETVSEISLTNLSVITCLNSLHLNRWRNCPDFLAAIRIVQAASKVDE